MRADSVTDQNVLYKMYKVLRLACQKDPNGEGTNVLGAVFLFTALRVLITNHSLFFTSLFLSRCVREPISNSNHVVI